MFCSTDSHALDILAVMGLMFICVGKKDAQLLGYCLYG